MTTTQTGMHLAQLRQEAGLMQNELAKNIGWSAAVLSRIESGERPVSDDELRSILESIGTEKALGYRETAGRKWEQLSRPHFGHPDEALLWRAEETLRSISDLRNKEDIKTAFAHRLNENEKEIKNAAELVRRTEYAIAFIGDIGIGKTTAICRVADLLMQMENKTTPAPVLEVGAGGITVCDVHIAQGPKYGIRVEPRTEEEIRREVREFVNLLMTPQDAHQENGDNQDFNFNGTSKELERAIRNMSGLTIQRTRIEGKRVSRDPAKELVQKSNDADKSVLEILDKMTIKNRTRREMWHSPISGKEPLVWLSEIFGEINNGRHSEFSIPKRLDIIMSEQILGENDLSIRLIDTKGIDDTAQRADIESHFGEPYTVVVLCSRFNDAPATSVQQLIERADEGQLTNNLKAKSAILVLPKHDEALAVKDDQGYPVESREDGYELKGDQADMRLMGKFPDINRPDFHFFDAFNDDTQNFSSALLELVYGLRRMYSDALEEIITDANSLVSNYEDEQVKAVQQQAAAQLKAWVKTNQQVSPSAEQVAKGFLNQMRVPYASSVRASIRREGDWHNLHYPYELGYQARSMATRTLNATLVDFNAVTKNILANHELEDAYGLVREASRIIESGAETLRRKAQLWGNSLHDEMKNYFDWDKCEEEWGGGSGYRNRVIDHHRRWFAACDEDDQTNIQRLFDAEWAATLKRLESILEE